MLTEYDLFTSLMGDNKNLKVFMGVPGYYIFFTNYKNCNVLDKTSVKETINNINKRVDLSVIK